MNDILVTGLNKIDFTRNLNNLFKCLFENGVRIKSNKLIITKHEIEWLGYKLTTERVVSDERKLIL